MTARWPTPRTVYVLMDEYGNPDQVTHIAPEKLWKGAPFKTYRIVEGDPMSKVNTLTLAGRRLLDQIDQVEKDLGECDVGRMNDAVTALAATVKALILEHQPLWELEEQ